MSVWKCGKCGNTTRTGFRGPSGKAPICAWCHTQRHMARVERTVVPVGKLGDVKRREALHGG